jgi:integrase
LAKWSDFFGEAVIADLTPQRQEAFIDHLRDAGASDGYVSRVLSVGRAALNRAWKRQEITAAPFIFDVEKGTPRERRLSPAEVAALLSAAASVPHLLTFTMIALNTLARPEAILDLSPFQIDIENRLIHLNPPGRKQTKKYRPVVPLTEALLPFVLNVKADRIMNWHGKPIERINKGFKTIAKRAGLSSDVSPYTLRHTMATELYEGAPCRDGKSKACSATRPEQLRYTQNLTRATLTKQLGPSTRISPIFGKTWKPSPKIIPQPLCVLPACEWLAATLRKCLETWWAREGLNL